MESFRDMDSVEVISCDVMIKISLITLQIV
jgi:hypothetical protein